MRYQTIYNNMHYVYIITSVELDAKDETGQVPIIKFSVGKS